MRNKGRSGGRPSRAPIWLYLTFLVGWVAASVLIVRGATDDTRTTHSEAPAWFFVAGTGALIAALVERDIVGRRRTRSLLGERQAVIESLGLVTDPKLSQLPLYQLLDELLARVRTVLKADTSSAFLLERDSGVLRRTATSGFPAGDAPPIEVRLREGVIGQVAANRRGAVIVDAAPGPTTAPGTTSLVAVPLVAEGQLVGVIQAATRQRRQFGEEDLRLLQVVADRMAVSIDGTRLEEEARRATLAANGASRRLAVLADAGAVLARNFDAVEAMAAALGDAVVPTYVDWFAFHQLGIGGGPELVTSRRSGDVADDEGDWTDAVLGAVQGSSAQLVWGHQLQTEEAFRPARRLGLTSVALAPVVVRGLALGTLGVGTAGRRRGLRPGDVGTVQDLAARTAVAIERVLLGAETERSAARTARHAAQLERLTEGAFAINAALASPALAEVVAEQAARVLDADAAVVQLGAKGAKARHGRVAKTAFTATAALTDTAGASNGSVSVARKASPFTPEDEAILASLAQMASVASANTRLYETVQDSETRLRALYDASPVGIVELDEGGAPVRWNRAAEVVFGWPAYEAAAPAEVPEVARTLLEQVLGGDQPLSQDARLGETDVELVAVPLRERDRGVRGAVLAVVDVTERQQVAEQLRQAQRMEAMATMAGGIAHDFNNVLMVISGYADLLLRRPVDDEVRSDVTAMRDAAGRAADMTRKLLTISRRQVVQPQVVDVAATLESLRSVLDVMVGSAVTLDLEIADPPHVLVDPAQFEQVVLNLAINARDAMPKGGTITIRSCGAPDGTSSVLEVGDTGEGMDPETLEHCFEPFFTTKERAKGTGLGLSTVYGVVTQAGGTITVDSRLGEGTTFRVSFPASTEEVGTGASSDLAGGDGLRILVVDDQREVRTVVAEMLELEGHEVVVASSAKRALTALESWPADVMVSDVVMPRMRGTELAARVAAEHPDVGIVLMSGHVDDAQVLDAVPPGVQFIGKPFSARALQAAIGVALSGRPQGSKR